MATWSSWFFPPIIWVPTIELMWSRVAASAFTSWASSWLLVSFFFPGGVLMQARPASNCSCSWDDVELLLFLLWLLSCTKPVPPYPVYTALGLEPTWAFVTGGQASCRLGSALCLKFWCCELLRSPFWLWCTRVVDSPHSCRPLALSSLIFVNLVDEMVSHCFAMSSQLSLIILSQAVGLLRFFFFSCRSFSYWIA